MGRNHACEPWVSALWLSDLEPNCWANVTIERPGKLVRVDVRKLGRSYPSGQVILNRRPGHRSLVSA